MPTTAVHRAAHKQASHARRYSKRLEAASGVGTWRDSEPILLPEDECVEQAGVCGDLPLPLASADDSAAATGEDVAAAAVLAALAKALRSAAARDNADGYFHLIHYCGLNGREA